MAKGTLGAAVNKVAQNSVKKQTSNVSKVKNNTTSKSTSSNTKKTTSTKSSTSSKKTTTKKNPTVKVNSAVESYDVLGTIGNNTSLNTNNTMNMHDFMESQNKTAVGEITNNTSFNTNSTMNMHDFMESQNKTAIGEITNGTSFNTSSMMSMNDFINQQKQKAAQTSQLTNVKTDSNTASNVKKTVKTDQKKSTKKNNKKLEVSMSDATGSVTSGNAGALSTKTTVNQKQTSNNNNKTKKEEKNKKKKKVETEFSDAVGTITNGSNLQTVLNQNQTIQNNKTTAQNTKTSSNNKNKKKNNVEVRMSDATGTITSGTTGMQTLVNQNQTKQNTNSKNKKKDEVDYASSFNDINTGLTSGMSMAEMLQRMQSSTDNQPKQAQKIQNSPMVGTEVNTPGIGSFSYKEIKQDGFTTQGITETDKYYYVSAYSKEGETKGTKSRIYLYDKTTGAYAGYIKLNTIAHVGGITYDKDDGLIFISGVDGTVDCLNYNNLNRAIEVAGVNASGCVLDLTNPSYQGSSIFVKTDISVKNKTHVGKASTVYYKDGRLYVSTFDGVNKGESVAFDINYNAKKGTVSSKVSQKITVPKQTQGFAITEYQGSKYMVTTQSISSSKSNVLVYKLNNDGSTEYQGKIYLDKGLEGIDIDDSGNIVAVYEKGAGNTYKSTMADLMNSISKYEDKEQEQLASAAGQRYNNKRNISTIKVA